MSMPFCMLRYLFIICGLLLYVYPQPSQLPPVPNAWGFGNNQFNNLGIGPGPTATPFPTPIPTFTGTNVSSAKNLTGGEAHSLGNTLDFGRAYSWGTDVGGRGALGLNSQAIGANFSLPQNIPQFIGQNSTYAEVSAGGRHSVAWTRDFNVYTWGDNECGQLGYDPTTTPFLAIPSPVEGFNIPIGANPVIYASAGGRHTLVVDSNGLVYAFGCNDRGQLGSNDFSNSFRPRQVLGNLASYNGTPQVVVAVSAGLRHSLAWTTEGLLFEWGIRQDAAPDALLPYEVVLALTTDPPGFKHLVVGATAGDSDNVGHNLAWTRDFLLFAWGYNNRGQLGTGDKKTRPNPTLIYNYFSSPILQFNNAITAATGVGHTLLITQQPYVIYATGANDLGQLGTGQFSDDFVVFTPIANQSDPRLTPGIGAGYTWSFLVNALPFAVPPIPTLAPFTLAPITNETVPPTLSPTLSPTTAPTNFTPTFIVTVIPTDPPTDPPTDSPTDPPTEFPTLFPTLFPTEAPTMNITNVTLPVVIAALPEDNEILLLIAAIVLTAALLCCLILLGLAFWRRRKRKIEGEAIEAEESIEIESGFLQGLRRELSESDVGWESESAPSIPIYPPYPLKTGEPDPMIDVPTEDSDSTEYDIVVTNESHTPPISVTSESRPPSLSDSSQIELPSTEEAGAPSPSDSSQLDLGPNRRGSSPIESGDELVFPGGGSAPRSTSPPPDSLSGDQEILFPGGGSGPRRAPSNYSRPDSVDSGSSEELVFPGGQPDHDDGSDSPTPTSSEEEELVFNWFR